MTSTAEPQGFEVAILSTANDQLLLANAYAECYRRQWVGLEDSDNLPPPFYVIRYRDGRQSVNVGQLFTVAVRLMLAAGKGAE